MSDRPGQFQRRKEEKVGIVAKGNISLLSALSFKDAELDHRWWIDGSSVSRGCEPLVKSCRNTKLQYLKKWILTLCS